MKKIRTSKKLLGMTLAFALSFALLVPTMNVHAASFVTGKINGDGVCFRAQGYSGGTVLGLMYKGEKINYYPTILGTDSEYNYIMRTTGSQAGWYGHVDHHYVSF